MKREEGKGEYSLMMISMLIFVMKDWSDFFRLVPLHIYSSFNWFCYVDKFVFRWDHVCPQPGINLGKIENPLLAQFFAEHPDKMTEKGLPGAVIGSEDCLHLAVFTPEVNI